MKASWIVGLRSAPLVRLLVVAAVAALLMNIGLPPVQCLAKTRPPVEAGDPDIGNDKPRPSGATVLHPQSSLTKRSEISPFNKRTAWYWVLIYSRTGLLQFGRGI